MIAITGTMVTRISPCQGARFDQWSVIAVSLALEASSGVRVRTLATRYRFWLCGGELQLRFLWSHQHRAAAIPLRYPEQRKYFENSEQQSSLAYDR